MFSGINLIEHLLNNNFTNPIIDSKSKTPDGSLIVTSIISRKSEIFDEVNDLTSYNKLLYPTQSNFSTFGFKDIRLIEGNNFCPPYPDCIPEEKIGTQTTAECTDL